MNRSRNALALVIVVASSLGLSPRATEAQTLTKLYSFPKHSQGILPVTGVIFDRSGDLYGTNFTGGTGGLGTVYELSPSADGTWTEKTLYSFGSVPDAGLPYGRVVLDAVGNLYGVTYQGGTYNSGAVYELSPSSNGNWTEDILYSFSNGLDGAYPQSPLVFDLAGNLYGTAAGGGTNHCGTVFELSPNNGAWAFQVLYRFGSSGDGCDPVGNLVFDQQGNLFSTTADGGSSGTGTVFELQPLSGGGWQESVLYSFPGLAEPFSGVLIDKAGNLYGTGRKDGQYNAGTVFELSPNSDGTWTRTVLYSFRGLASGDGATPTGNLLFDKGTDIWGATGYGGDGTLCGKGCGTIFHLSPNPDGSWKEVHVDLPANSAYPYGSLVFDQHGNLYGTAAYSSAGLTGTVFELVP